MKLPITSPDPNSIKEEPQFRVVFVHPAGRFAQDREAPLFRLVDPVVPDGFAVERFAGRVLFQHVVFEDAVGFRTDAAPQFAKQLFVIKLHKNQTIDNDKSHHRTPCNDGLLGLFLWNGDCFRVE